MTAAVLGAVLVLGLAGCGTPEPAEPTPTPAFSSEAEAFAAAEETYRAYVEALNQVDLSDPNTFEPVYELTTGDLNASERKNLSRMSADEWTVNGTTVITRIDRLKIDPSTSEVQLGACADVSAVELRDAAGNSVVTGDRPPIQSVRVTLEIEPPGNLRVSDIVGYELDPICD